MDEGYTATADYHHIDAALKSFWGPFNDLWNEMASFVPRPLSDFDHERGSHFERVRELNPNMSNDEIDRYVERVIESSRSPEYQYIDRFSERVMTMYVTVTLLSQALCEAEINAILAVGFYENGLADQFAKLERADDVPPT